MLGCEGRYSLLSLYSHHMCTASEGLASPPQNRRITRHICPPQPVQMSNWNTTYAWPQGYFSAPHKSNAPTLMPCGVLEREASRMRLTTPVALRRSSTLSSSPRSRTSPSCLWPAWGDTFARWQVSSPMLLLFFLAQGGMLRWTPHSSHKLGSRTSR